MSCLSLKFPLRPAGKAWKRFTFKLQTKLRIFHTSKSINKAKHRQQHLTAFTKRKKRSGKGSHAFRFGLHLQKAPAPVYIDKLFQETGGTSKGSSSSSSGEKEIKKTCGGDDHVWESLVLASPQMAGIDERAEEFIARFRAEMEHQEMLVQSMPESDHR